MDMIFKHSIKSMIRTPKKTLLFLFLLIVLTIFLSIGAGMYESARNMLTDADQTFNSVVELDYLGDFNGDEENFYQSMNLNLADFNFNKLEMHSNVKAVGMESAAWAFIDENADKQSNTPLSDYIMIKIDSIIKYQDNLYLGIVKEVLFGNKVRENAYIVINDMDEQGMPNMYNFDSDHTYLITGKVAKGTTPMLILSPRIPEPVENNPSIIDLTENPDFLVSEEGKLLLQLQEAMKVVDNSLLVTIVSSLEATEPYYFNEILVKEGRIFNPLEYQEGNNEELLISEAVADLYQVKVGDKLKLKLHYNKSGTGNSDFLTDSKFDYEADYEIVGIFKNKEDNKYIVYMPKADWIKQEFHSTTLSRYIVKNGTGVKFIEDYSNSLLPNMEFTLYDQGYGEAVKPIIALKNNAIIIIVLGTLSGIAILILFSYLLVIKQEDTLKSMLSLGTGKRRTRKYILYGSISLVLLASAIGAIITGFILNKVTVMFFESMKDTYGTDLRYSERSIGLRMNFEPQVRVNPWLPVVVIIVILLISFLFLFSITNSVMRENRHDSLRKAIKKEKIVLPKKLKVAKVSFGRVKPITLKFALISMTRKPGRSFIIPLISLILSIFIVFLGLLSSISQEELDTVYDRVPVTAYMTSFKDESRVVGGLDLKSDIYRLIDPYYSGQMPWGIITYDDLDMNDKYKYLSAQKERDELLANSEFFEAMSLYTAIHYEFMGIAKTSVGEEDKELSQFPDIRKHSNAYGYDWFLDKINHMPKLAYADDFRYTPEFFNHPEPEVEFQEGYSLDSLRLGEKIGLISQNLATAYGVENGDTIRITAWFELKEEAVCSVIDFKVIGIYDANWKTETIYLPWIMSYSHNFCLDSKYPTGNEQDQIVVISNEYLPGKVKTATFTLKNTKELSAFRDYIETGGYSQVGKISIKRRVIVIQDKNLVETVQNLKNHIRLIDTIKPIMLFLFGIIGFVVSFLLIRHRTSELAIMRSMGAKKRLVFFSFFMEQMILFFVGLIPVVAYALILPDKVMLYGGSLVYFILCYLMGTAIALIIMNRAKILDILFTKE